MSYMNFQIFELEVSLITPQRIDQFLAESMPNLSRTEAKKYVEQGCVKIAGQVVNKCKAMVKNGDFLIFERPVEKQAPSPFKAEAFTYDILFEDEDILVINKPPHVVVHPAPGHYDSGTVVHALLSYIPNLQTEYDDDVFDELEAMRPGIVHRLDKDTSGCLVIAKNRQIRTALMQMFAAHQIHKTYLALTYRAPKERTGEICNLIGRHRSQRQKMAVVERNGKEAITRYQVMRTGLLNEKLIAEIELELLTGRTHQIRVHLASLQSPILGDKLYGGKQEDIAPRQMLHAYKIEFIHPKTKQNVEIIAPIAADMQSVMAQVNWVN